MRSYWDTTSWQSYDIAIIGGGIIGISTAISCATRFPGRRIVVLERGHVPCGATTRNAGFACFGSLSEIAHDIDIMGADAAHDLVRKRMEGLQLLLQRCTGYDIGYHADGGSEVFLHDHPALQRCDEVNALLADIIGEATFRERPDLRAEYQISSSAFAFMHTTHEGTLHSGKLLQGLWSVAAQHGVHLRTGTEVVSIDTDSTTATLHCVSPLHEIDLTCSHVVVATNAMIPTLVSSSTLPTITPGRGQILVTAPIPGLALRGSVHLDEGYYYVRELDGRVLIGGGRNLDFEGETTTSHDTTDRIQRALEELLHTVILPQFNHIAIEQRWAGTMAFTETKQPIVAAVEPRVLVAFGCNGMGIALGSSIGEECAHLLH